MKHLVTLAMAALAAGTMIAAEIADAKRLGGGRSLGAQRQATPPPAAPSSPAAAPSGAASNPVMPAQPGAAAAMKGAPAAGAAGARTGASRWLGPVAGIAAGLGLAALASHLGIAEEMMSLIVVVLIALAAFALLRMFLARRAAPSRPLEYAHARSAAGAGAIAGPAPVADEPVFGGARAPRDAAPAVSAAAPKVPPGFAVEPFIRQARVQFARVQDAYDKNDRDALADVMTPELFAEVAHDLEGRANHAATEVVALNAELLEVVTDGDRHWASVRFRGLVREDGEPMPRPLDEIWNLSKPADGSSGWLLAGIQQPDQQPAPV
jgi:predicted lipid-binding transport protein (Tim44 family)